MIYIWNTDHRFFVQVPVVEDLRLISSGVPTLCATSKYAVRAGNRCLLMGIEQCLVLPIA